MELLQKIAWAMLVLIHLPPALVLFFPNLLLALYGVDSAAEIALLLMHRGALFLCVALLGIAALLRPHYRPIAVLCTAVSMGSFLFLYWRLGWPAGALRTIANVDLLGLLPLAVVALGCVRDGAPGREY